MTLCTAVIAVEEENRSPVRALPVHTMQAWQALQVQLHSLLIPHYTGFSSQCSSCLNAE